MTAVAERQTVTDLLLAADRKRPRSTQRAFGMSEIGGCRKRAGYRLARIEPTDDSGSMQAVIGTAVHAALEAALRQNAQPGDLIEHEVEFAGILGHLDYYHAATRTVRDLKTTSSRWLEHVKVHGPDPHTVWQPHVYAVALIAAGIDVQTVALDYIARDTGEEWNWQEPVRPAAVAEALTWLDEFRSTELEMLPRDYAPDSAFCGGCPFRTVCWDGAVADRDPRSVLYVEDADAAKWAQQLWDARRAKAAATELEEQAKGALDALRPNDEGTVTVDVGWERPITWQVSKGARSLDKKAVEADYKAAGAQVPYKHGQPSVKVLFGAPGSAVA